MEKEFQIVEFWQIIIKQWKILAAIPLLAVLTSLFISIYIITPVYSSATTLMITRQNDSPQIMFSDLQVSRQLVQTYREIALSRRVLELTVDSLGLDYSIEDIRRKVEVQAVRDTELITIEVKDHDPVVASIIANELASIFIEQILEIMNVENVSVVDAAIATDRAISPRVPLIALITFLASSAAAFGIVFLLEHLDRTIREPEVVRDLTGINVLGVVPIADGYQLFSLNEPHALASEALRTLRTNIQFASVDKKIKRLLVTGANPSCGKSTVVSNLGVVLAQAGARVLLIDADLRKPTISKIFDLNTQQGLTDVFVDDKITISDVVQKSEQDGLFILGSGPIPPYPSELLASESMRDLIDTVDGQYDYLLFDAPPVIAVTDAAILSSICDGTLVVFDYGRVNKVEALSAINQLQNVQANIIGAVLNAVPLNRKSYYNGYEYQPGKTDVSEKSYCKSTFI